VDAAVVIYVDDFGNVMTGRYADALTQDESPVLPGVRRARTFGDVEVGGTLWYRNSMGLVEIAVNQGSAAERYGLAIGDPVEFGRGSPGKG
jgi:S-adenosylmethionine hydrolase